MKRKKKKEICKITWKLEWSKNETVFKECQEALNGSVFSPEQFCKVPLDIPPSFQNYITKLIT